jgi:hypothetical protein
MQAAELRMFRELPAYATALLPPQSNENTARPPRGLSRAGPIHHDAAARYGAAPDAAFAIAMLSRRRAYRRQTGAR